MISDSITYLGDYKDSILLEDLENDKLYAFCEQELWDLVEGRRSLDSLIDKDRVMQLVIKEWLLSMEQDL